MFKKIFLGLLVSLVFMSSAYAQERFKQMISPISNPVNFEDPRATTELRPIFMYHKIDDSFPTQGGDVQLYALQGRYAINDRLAIIATKDGLIDFNPDAGLESDTGFANIAAGVKYAFYKDDYEGSILTAGLRYEAPVGNTGVLQGEGDGAINPFLSGGLALGTVNVIAGTGIRAPFDSSYSTFYDFDLHVDVPLGNFFPTFELNTVTVLDAGDKLPTDAEGFDIFNFGSTDSDGETIVTASAGARYRFADGIDGGIAYQVPLTNGSGSSLIDWRITADMIFWIPE